MLKTKHELCGFINVDKPVDWTSHDVVAKLRRVLNFKQIGHTGTLDPFATGVLPVAIGSATRLIRFLPKSKRYLAEMDLSFTTDTDDLTGEALKSRSGTVSEEEFKSQLLKMQGSLDQVPPLYSAKKINGKKLYELMREGHDLDLNDIKFKTVFIKEIKILEFNYPIAKIDVSCSEGTYIRSIARDLGGHLTVLRRLESNGFDIKSTIRFEDLKDGDLNPENLILDANNYLENIPQANFNRKDSISLQQGQNVILDDEVANKIMASYVDDQEKYLRCIDLESKELIGLGIILFRGRGEILVQPKVMLS